MPLKLYNTLSSSLKEFRPIKSGHVGMYHCGPTVYDRAHIGNFRSYVFADILRRTLEYLNFEVIQVINITDIGHLTSDADTGDDKMVKGLKREALPITLDGLKQLANKYEKFFEEDLDRLNIEKPHHFPRATGYLKEEIELVKILEEKGFTYKTIDGIYFNTGKFEDYGKLGGLTPEEESITRVTGNKKSLRDFVLWKFSRDNHLGFESPWGKGFPGWHIECSAMSRKLLGQPFDIHTGGVDHIPVHHNNEIAQSEAAYNTSLANYWLHNEWIKISGKKMAKSEGNFITLKSLEEKGFSPLAYRYFLLLSHYRTPTSFTWEALEAAENAYRRLKESFTTLDTSDGCIDKKYQEEFEQSLENDLNTPGALAVVWKLVKDTQVSSADKRATLNLFDEVLGLDLEHNEYEIKDVPPEITQILEERKAARAKKDWTRADELRQASVLKGYDISDTDEGQKLKKL